MPACHAVATAVPNAPTESDVQRRADDQDHQRPASKPSISSKRACKPGAGSMPDNRT